MHAATGWYALPNATCGGFWTAGRVTWRCSIWCAARMWWWFVVCVHRSTWVVVIVITLTQQIAALPGSMLCPAWGVLPLGGPTQHPLSLDAPFGSWPGTSVSHTNMHARTEAMHGEGAAQPYPGPMWRTRSSTRHPALPGARGPGGQSLCSWRHDPDRWNGWPGQAGLPTSALRHKAKRLLQLLLEGGVQVLHYLRQAHTHAHRHRARGSGSH